MDKKQKLCRMKQNCPQFISEKPCGFDHVLCKFNETCKDRQKCIFYHMANSQSNKPQYSKPQYSKPQSDKPQYDKPKSETLCKFNQKCTKPGCPFKHQKREVNQQENVNVQQKNNFMPKAQFPSNKFNQVCKFGEKCIRADCSFQHPNRQNKAQPDPSSSRPFNGGFQMQGKKEVFSFQPQNNQSPFSSQQKRPQNRFCLDFLMANKCQNGQGCPRLHEFTQKSSVKRLFFSNQVPAHHFSMLFYEHAKQGQQRQNKEVVYAIQQNETISFKKLISSQNLFKQYGGIGLNQENKTYLRSIQDRLFKAQGVINGMQAFTFQENQYLVFLSGQNITIYNTTQGLLTYSKTQKMGNKLTGCVLIPQKATLLLTTLEEGPKRFQFNSQLRTFQQIPLNQRYNFVGLKFLRSADSQILGQSIIYGVNTQSNNLILMNKQLKASLIQFPNQTVLNDAQVCLFNNKIPVCFVSATIGGRQHQVICVNLLNFQKQLIMQYEFNAGINKIFVSEGHLMIQVKNKGLLIYKLNETQNDIGMIPLMNEIQQVRKDNKGNLLILQSSSVDSKGSISIFKVRKI